MEIKLIASSIGAAIPRIGVGFSLFAGVYIMTRRTPNDKPYVLGIASKPEIGGNNGSLIASHVETAWLKIDLSKHNWLCNRHALAGKRAEVKLSGTLVYKGKLDLSITVFDDQNESIFSIDKVDVASTGGQLTDTAIRGTIVDMMGKTRHGEQLCQHP
ncbi:MAG TPA: hypothetical protein VFX23_08410 [Limnobacter sp.]|uniref:hypothetical protein n=1 Tax=Limnobacter sp. TaxID=2003368 RepID=UPI002E2F1917|nr:hypothetical protein [Limnobacter sp.]HEX5486006.1 hypothetical protein [Limnobacter sp.]